MSDYRSEYQRLMDQQHAWLKRLLGWVVFSGIGFVMGLVFGLNV